MVGHFEELFSECAREQKASEIRELLKLVQQPDIISFAGGLPGPEAFPVEEIKEICADILKTEGKVALQYGTTEGVPKFKKILVEFLHKDKIDVNVDNLLITVGSQEALDLIGKVFINKGDTVVVGAPSYLGGLQAFSAYQAVMESVPLDDENMHVDVLEDTLHRLHRHGRNVKFVYVIPTFDNPAGTTMPEKRRKKLIELAHEYDILIVEDNPYSKLRYEGTRLNHIKSYDEDNECVIYLQTFSKLIAPGFRLGLVAAHEEIIKKLVIAKQSVNLCTPTFVQYIAYEFIARGYLEPHIEMLKKIYGAKRDVMLNSIESNFSDEIRWTRPQGGMFVWVTLPRLLNARDMLGKAIKKKVAYVTGSSFFADGSGKNNMRLNFSHATHDGIRKGITRLAEVIEAEMKLKKGVLEKLPFEGEPIPPATP